MIAVSRFKVPETRVDEFQRQAAQAVDVLRVKPGLLSLDLGQNLDDPELWTIVSRWENVGSYRRALGGLESKMTVVPLLSLAIDEPSAFDDPEHVGENRPRGW